MLIDYLLALISLAFGIRLIREGRRRIEVSILVFAGGFIAAAIALACAGTAHGFVARLGGGGLEFTFRLAALMVGLASFCLAAGVVLACFGGIRRRLLLAVVSFQLMVFAFWIVNRSDERVVLLDLGAGLLLAAALEAWAWRRRQAASAGWIVAGAAAALVALALWQQWTRWLAAGTAEGLQLADLALYLLVLIALFLLYGGGRRLHDRMPE